MEKAYKERKVRCGAVVRKSYLLSLRRACKYRNLFTKYSKDEDIKEPRNPPQPSSAFFFQELIVVSSTELSTDRQHYLNLLGSTYQELFPPTPLFGRFKEP